MRKTNSTHQQKILELLYTREPANDLLAFEMMKHLEMDRELLIPLIYIQKNTKDKQFSKDISAYLSDDSKFQSGFSSERELSENIVKTIRSGGLKYLMLKGHFLEKEYLNLLFFLAIRTRYQRWLALFLKHDNGEHPKRNLIVDVLVASQTQKSFSFPINIYGLFFHELESVGKELLKNSSGRDWINFIFSDLKTDVLPADFQKINFNIVEIKSINQKYISTFPKYLSSISSISTLRLFIDSIDFFPKEIKLNLSLNRLELHCSKDLEFTNFDFLNIFPNLKQVTIHGGLISHPSIFLNLSFAISTYDDSTGWKSKAGYDIKVSDWAIANIASYLNEMPLSKKDRVYFYPKFLALRNLANLSSFSDKDLKWLEQFIPSRFGNERITHWGISKELTLRSLGTEIDFNIKQLQ